MRKSYVIPFLKSATGVFLSMGLLTSPILSFADNDQNVAPTAKTSEKLAIREKTEDIWKAIDSEVSTLDQIIEKNQSLDQVHHHAFAIRDLVNALLKQSTPLVPEKQQQLQAYAKFVEMLAKRLDESGDKKDKAAVQTDLDKLKKIKGF